MATKYRGLYGQSEGNEQRQNGEWVEDRIHENWLVEGEWLRPMTDAAERGDLKEMGRLRDAMKRTYVKGGVAPDKAQDRADTVLRQAMGKLRL